jgi:hypothetical protein
MYSNVDFHISSKNKEEEKVRPSVGEIPSIDFTFLLNFLPNKMGVNEKRCKSQPIFYVSIEKAIYQLKMI